MKISTMAGRKRTHRCAEVDEGLLGQQIILTGWVQRQRDLGALTFITLRDRSGLVQLVVDEDSPQEARDIAQKVRSEFVLLAEGTFRLRQDPNPEMPTGLWELHVESLEILSKAQTPPFYIEDGIDTREQLRLKHRYLDLRRPELQKIFLLRSKLANLTRQFFAENGFIDLDTPILGKSTPEGARDYLVPSRVFPGEFFALPQSPQLYKQLLMIAGFDRYFQITRCFRDEDLRADRQPEFTQIDLEMSFVNEEDVHELVERYVREACATFNKACPEGPFQKMTYQEAMRRFGVDKPDLRFGMELVDQAETAKTMDFRVFTGALEAGGAVQTITVPGGASMTRREIDALTDFVKTYRAKGLAWLVPSEEPRSSFLKFLNEEQIAAFAAAGNAGPDDLLLFVADELPVVQDALGHLRVHLARELDLIDPDRNEMLWITEFPLLEYDEEEERYVSKHHPFTLPNPEDLHLLETDPSRVRAKAYDLVINGQEMAGGSLRIHDEELQLEILKYLGFSEERAKESFGFLLEAFQYGVPPHGGIAFGLDRWVMFFAGTENIRDVIAFPKVQSSACLMTEAPGDVSNKQLEELHLSITATDTESDEVE